MHACCRARRMQLLEFRRPGTSLNESSVKLCTRAKMHTVTKCAAARRCTCTCTHVVCCVQEAHNQRQAASEKKCRCECQSNTAVLGLSTDSGLHASRALGFLRRMADASKLYRARNKSMFKTFAPNLPRSLQPGCSERAWHCDCNSCAWRSDRAARAPIVLANQ